MVKRCVLLTVHDREPAVLMSTLRSLHRSGLGAEEEVVVVDDRSSKSLAWAEAYARALFENVTWLRLDGYESFDLEGYRCPAKAFNAALVAARGADIWVMSSDVLVTPAVIAGARRIDTSEMIWTPKVIDTESGMVYCGQSRLFPMPWFLACSRAKAIEVGGWDEAYQAGLCFEDNDFVGRIVLATGAFCGEWSCVAYHQSHDQPAYAIDDPIVKAANERNRAWTMEKWGGIPFDSEYTPFDVTRKMHPSGLPLHACIEKSGKLGRCINLTKGPFAKATA